MSTQANNPVPNTPSHHNPGQTETGTNQGQPSQPKKPGNDPDQTPEREVKPTPQGEPGKGDTSKTTVNPLPGK